MVTSSPRPQTDSSPSTDLHPFAALGPVSPESFHQKSCARCHGSMQRLATVWSCEPCDAFEYIDGTPGWIDWIGADTQTEQLVR